MKGTPATIAGDPVTVLPGGQIVPRRRGGNKYGAERALGSSGRSYPSKLERDVADYYHALAAAGDICDLREQYRVRLAGKVFFRVDFSWRVRGERDRRFAEAKGFQTDRWRVIVRLWEASGPGPLQIIVRGRRGNFYVAREILPKRRARGRA